MNEIKGADVLAWLREQPGDKRLGSPDLTYGKTCAVGAYLNRDGEGWVASFTFGERDDGAVVEFDDTACEMVSVFDGLRGYDHTVTEFLEAWDGK